MEVNYKKSMKKSIFAALLLPALLVQACGQREVEPEVKVVERVVPAAVQRMELRDFTDVAAATIDGVVHIKTEMTQLTPLYQSFFGFIIPQGVQKQVYNAYGSGVIITAEVRDFRESASAPPFRPWYQGTTRRRPSGPFREPRETGRLPCRYRSG